MKTPKCIVSGEKVRNGDIFASKEASDLYAASSEELAKDLIAKGFVRIESTPNLFIKDGRAVTLEAYRHDPLGTLDRHARQHG